MPKVLCVTNTIVNLQGHRRALIRGLLAEGYEVVLAVGGRQLEVVSETSQRPNALTPKRLNALTPKRPNAPTPKRLNALTPKRPNALTPKRLNALTPKRLNALTPHSRNPLRGLFLILELYRLMRRERPDYVLLFTIQPNIYGNFAAWLAGAPTISTLTGLGYALRQGRGLTALAVRILYRLALRWPRRVYFHNAGDLQWMVERRLVPAEKCAVVPGSGVDLRHYRPRVVPLGEGPFVFLFLGRLLRDKGLPELAEAAARVRARHPSVEVWVAGAFEPSYPIPVTPEEMQRWTGSGALRYLGDVDDVRPLLRRAQALVLPSHHEGMPGVVLQAMAMARPVIASDIPACREAVADGETGFLHQIGDVGSLADAMLRMLSLTPYERFDMGRKGRMRAARLFSVDQVVKCYLAASAAK